MENLRIIFVPGKNPKPEPAAHKEQVWRCILRGVEQVDTDLAKKLAARPEILEIAAWNYIYYNRYKSLVSDLPLIENVLKRDGATDDEKKHTHSFRLRMGKIIYTVVDWFPVLINISPDPAVKAVVRETRRYFENQKNIACRVREIIKDQIKDAWSQNQNILLIGHSMGSVICYDSLWELGREEGYRGKIDLFLTLGSPLGMRFAQHRLVDVGKGDDKKYPNNIRHWVNISAMGDLTALDPYLANDFEDMVNNGLVEDIRDQHKDVYNYFINGRGLNVHRSYGYLVNAKVGAVIVDWLNRVGSNA